MFDTRGPVPASGLRGSERRESEGGRVAGGAHAYARMYTSDALCQRYLFMPCQRYLFMPCQGYLFMVMRMRGCTHIDHTPTLTRRLARLSAGHSEIECMRGDAELLMTRRAGDSGPGRKPQRRPSWSRRLRETGGGAGDMETRPRAFGGDKESRHGNKKESTIERRAASTSRWRTEPEHGRMSSCLGALSPSPLNAADASGSSHKAPLPSRPPPPPSPRVARPPYHLLTTAEAVRVGRRRCCRACVRMA